MIRRTEVRSFLRKTDQRCWKPSRIRRSLPSRTCGCSRNSGAQRGVARGAGASDCNIRGARHHQPLADGRAAGARRHRRERCTGLWDRGRGAATPRGEQYGFAGSFRSHTQLVASRSVLMHQQCRWMREHGTLHIPDVRAQRMIFQHWVSLAELRTFLAAPLRLQGEFIGTLNARRTEVRPFTPAQIKLLETFADQAVIAIENVRLFKELETQPRSHRGVGAADGDR